MDSIRTRPRIKLTPTPMEIGLSIFSGLAVAAVWLLLAYYYGKLPATIYTHFGASGTPDATGPKSSLIPLPTITTLIYAMFTVLIRVPFIYNYPVPITLENAERQYGNAVAMMYWFRAEMVYLFVYIEWMMVQTALGRAHGMGVWFLLVVLLTTFGSLGHFVVQAYRNR